MRHPLVQQGARLAAKIDRTRKRHAEQIEKLLEEFDELTREVLTRNDMPNGTATALAKATGRNVRGLYLARDRAIERLKKKQQKKAGGESTSDQTPAAA